MTAPPVGLLSVNVAHPALLGTHRGQPVHSSIAKQPVTAPTLWLARLDLDGDSQADLTVHGGVDKAVYAYPSEHLAPWAAELETDLGPAAFGENLSTTGWTEADVLIGDRWAWGDAVLEVSQPRWPCFKLTLHRGRGDIGRRMRASGRTGWYLRVLQEGEVPVAGPIEVIERHPAGVSVLDAHQAATPGGMDEDEVREMLSLDPLALRWKAHLVDRLEAGIADIPG